VALRGALVAPGLVLAGGGEDASIVLPDETARCADLQRPDPLG
jgi:hypothetical protein